MSHLQDACWWHEPKHLCFQKNLCWGSVSWGSIVFHWILYLHNWCKYKGKIIAEGWMRIFWSGFQKEYRNDNSSFWLTKTWQLKLKQGAIWSLVALTCPPYKGIHPWRGCATCVLRAIPERGYFLSFFPHIVLAAGEHDLWSYFGLIFNSFPPP